MKRLKTSVARALEKGQIKVGDKIFIEATINEIRAFSPTLNVHTIEDGWIKNDQQILITKPEPKPIDFSVEGRILSRGGDIVKTTGFQISPNAFSGISIKSPNKGYVSNTWIVADDWQDITDTYLP